MYFWKIFPSSVPTYFTILISLVSDEFKKSKYNRKKLLKVHNQISHSFVVNVFHVNFVRNASTHTPSFQEMLRLLR